MLAVDQADVIGYWFDGESAHAHERAIDPIYEFFSSHSSIIPVFRT